MSVTVVVRVENGECPEVTFDGTRIVLGRGSGSDVRLPDASVSQRHASIQVDAGQHYLIDEGSMNGTFIGGARLEPRTKQLLRPNELVRLGRVYLDIRIEAKPATRDLSIATRDLALGLISKALRALGENPNPRVLVVSGRDTGQTLTLDDEGRIYVVGRGEECDLPLSDPDASRAHVRIVRRGSSVMVRDEDSKNGVFLGEEPLKKGRDTAWKGSAIVRAGSTHLALEEPANLVLAEIEREDDERLAPEDVPEPPPMAREEIPRDGLEAQSARGSSVSSALEEDGEARRSLPPESVGPRSELMPAKDGLSMTERTVIAIAGFILLASIAGLAWIFRTK